MTTIKLTKRFLEAYKWLVGANNEQFEEVKWASESSGFDDKYLEIFNIVKEGLTIQVIFENGYVSGMNLVNDQNLRAEAVLKFDGHHSIFRSNGKELYYLSKLDGFQKFFHVSLEIMKEKRSRA